MGLSTHKPVKCFTTMTKLVVEGRGVGEGLQGKGCDALEFKVIWVVVKNYGHFWGTLNNRCRIIIGTQKGP